MSKSAPLGSTSLLTVVSSLQLSKGQTLESIASQLQPETRRILCVVDGYLLTWFEKTQDIPSTLIFEHKKRNKRSGNFEYYYRCTSSDSLYAFFLDSVNDYLKLQEDMHYEGKVLIATLPRLETQILNFSS